MRRQPPPDPVVVEVDQEILSGYVGEFLFMGDKKLAIKLEHGRLWASTGSGDWAELAATSDTEFFVPGDDARFRFVREGAMSRAGGDRCAGGVDPRRLNIRGADRSRRPARRTAPRGSGDALRGARNAARR